MARATTVTALSIYRFAQLVRFNPAHFCQVQPLGPGAEGAGAACGTPLLQWDWQGAGRISRETVAQAILDAERLIETWTQFPLLPRWIVDEQVGLPSRSAHATARWGYVIEGGKVAKTPLTLIPVAGDDIVFDDVDGDGYDEKATVLVDLTGTEITAAEAEEIRLYYPGEAGEDQWEIRPIKVVVDSAVQATVTLRREQLVRPELVEGFGDLNELDGTDALNFLDTVDAFRVYNDPSDQATFRWSGSPSACVACQGTGCQVCEYTTQAGCIRVMAPREGLLYLTPAVWDEDEERFDAATFSQCTQPREALVSYRAGWRYRKSVVTMDPSWERAVVALALGNLGGTLCGCAQVGELSDFFSQDLARSESDPANSISFRVGKRVLENPFGTTRGAQIAWQLISEERIGQVGNLLVPAR